MTKVLRGPGGWRVVLDARRLEGEAGGGVILQAHVEANSRGPVECPTCGGWPCVSCEPEPIPGFVGRRWRLPALGYALALSAMPLDVIGLRFGLGSTVILGRPGRVVTLHLGRWEVSALVCADG